MGMVVDLHALAKRVDDTSRNNGWDISTWENIPVKVMMTVTELDEAHDFVVGGPSDTADPLPEELADTAIRLMSILYSVFGTGWHDRRQRRVEKRNKGLALFEPVEVSLWRILKPMSKACEAWRHDNRDDTCGFLEQALKETFNLAARLGIDLDEEIIQKDIKNSKRGHLHGKARSAG